MAKLKKKRLVKPATDGLATALIKSIDALTQAVRAGTQEMRRYRRMIQNPGVPLDDTPGRGIPDGALLETDRARAMAEDEE